MKILALEFSSPCRAVALVDVTPAGNTVLGEVADRDYRGKTGLVLIQQTLEAARVEPSEVDIIAVGRGPGSYTGIRASIALAQGWQLGRSTPIVGISTVEILAAQCAAAGFTGRVQVIIDAQRRELYSAQYEMMNGAIRLVKELEIIAAESLQPGPDLLVVGPEASRFCPTGRELLPEAATLAHLASSGGTSSPGELLEPIYLRATTFVKAPPPRQI